MIFQDNVLKKYLENVYFIAGTACGGKTTISKALSEKYGFFRYDADEYFPQHQLLSDPAFQPAMNKHFQSADDFFGRAPEEYQKWLVDNAREQMDFILSDLIRLSQNHIVLCDSHLTLDEAEKLTDVSRVVFMIRKTKDYVSEYCNRADHQDFKNYLYSASDVEKAKHICNETLSMLNVQAYEDIKNSSYLWIERADASTIGHTLEMVEKHFRFSEISG